VALILLPIIDLGFMIKVNKSGFAIVRNVHIVASVVKIVRFGYVKKNTSNPCPVGAVRWCRLRFGAYGSGVRIRALGNSSFDLST
jgi:hypothetical protein